MSNSENPIRNSIIFLLILAIFSCQQSAEPERKPVVSDEINVVADTYAGSLEKTHIGQDLDVSWATYGEELEIVELASSTGRPEITEINTKSDYTLSSDTKTARFHFSTKKKTAKTYRYLAVYPRKAYQETIEGDDLLVAVIPPSQTPLADSPDASASIMGACSDEQFHQPESLKLQMEHKAAYGLMTLLNNPAQPGETVKKIEISVPDGKIAGPMQWNFTDSESEVTAVGSGNSRTISLDTGNLDTSGDIQVWFSCIPFTVSESDVLTVKLITDNTDYTRNITPEQDIEFESGRVAEFSLDLYTEAGEPTGTVIASGLSDVTTASAQMTATYDNVTSDGSNSAYPERMFVKYGTSESSLDLEEESGDRAQKGSGSYSVSLSGLTPNTTYYYQFAITVNGKTFNSSVTSFKTREQGGGEEYFKKSWLACYEIPGTDVTFEKGAVNYDGHYCHETVDEEHGDSKACIYNPATADQRIVTHTFEFEGEVLRTYTLLYDKNMRCALWCAFAMNRSGFPDKNVSRNDSWEFDPAIEESWQPDLKSAYNGSYSRGHQVASEDRQTTRPENRQTFYFSNMTPQNQSFNGGVWNVLEQEVQKQGYATNNLDTLYVVTGPIFNDSYKTTTDRNGKTCPVPTHYYKCTMKCSFNSAGEMTSASGAGYLFIHSSSSQRQSVSIDTIEKMTGFDFFANVPKELQDAAER